MRVHELAKQLNVPSKDVIQVLNKMGIPVKTAIYNIDEVAIQKVKDYFTKENAQKSVEPSATTQAKMPSKPEPVSTPPMQKPKEPETPNPPLKEEKSVAEKVLHVIKETPSRQPPHEKPKHIKEDFSHKQQSTAAAQPVRSKVIHIKGHIVVREFAEQLGMRPNQLISELMSMNVFVSINQRLDIKVAQQIAEKHGFTLERNQQRLNQLLHKKIWNLMK